LPLPGIKPRVIPAVQSRKSEILRDAGRINYEGTRSVEEVNNVCDGDLRDVKSYYRTLATRDLSGGVASKIVPIAHTQ
jgi:hypothetical protein